MVPDMTPVIDARNVWRRVQDGGEVTREDVETIAWRVCGWRCEQVLVDQLMGTVDAYVRSREPVAEVIAEPVAAASEPVVSVTLEPVSPVPGELVLDADGRILVDRRGNTEARCTLCLETKPVAAFGIDRTTGTGRKARCRPCLNNGRGDRGRRGATR